MSSFADLGVPAPLCATLARRGINEPFPIQAATLPDALAGRDVAGKAPTGSGKTLAFGLAIAAAAAAARTPEPRRPRALVLVPTRELAAQVQRELTALIDERAHGPVAAIYGGVGYGPQRKLLTRGVSAVVACPGRLEDLIATGDVRLDAVDIVVLDEADRMADMGFMPAVRRLLDRTPDDRQTLLFSATLDGDVDKLVRAYQHDPVHHSVAGADDDDVEVTHHFWTVAREARVGVTADIINRAGSTIVFTRTRHGADRVTRQLARYGVKAVPIHGRRSQAQRDQALKQFSTGRAPALIATDVAARGIHVDAVGCVVHFDLPDDPKDYVHRSGRTGRAGASGTVVALVGDDARKAARTLQRALGRDEPFEPADASKLPAAEPFVASRLDEVDGARTSERAEHGHNGGRSSGRGARCRALARRPVAGRPQPPGRRSGPRRSRPAQRRRPTRPPGARRVRPPPPAGPGRAQRPRPRRRPGRPQRSRRPRRGRVRHRVELQPPARLRVHLAPGRRRRVRPRVGAAGP